jgi:catechol 2,3-dioxygenase-like lactoylglutathione lyase family enzyme
MIIGVNHTSYTVSNLRRSVDFYCDTFGMKLRLLATRPREYTEVVTGISACELQIAILDAWGHVLELIEYVGPERGQSFLRPNTIGAGHICFNVTEIETTVSDLRKSGANLRPSATKVPSDPNRGGRVIYGFDPDNIAFELFEPASKAP